MKVIALNGSPRRENNTGQLIEVVAKELNEEEISVETINITETNYSGCLGCLGCRKNEDGFCVINDGLEEIQRKIAKSDGLILASPVYYAGISGQMKSVLDRIFFSPGVSRNMKRKPGATILSVRRGGALPAYNGLNHYFGITGMYTVGATYWNFVFGLKQGDCHGDEEGIRNMVSLGENMAYILKKLNN